MAGVETAGLILAALPIVVQVLQGYRSGLRQTFFLWGKCKSYERKVGKLANQLQILHNNLKQVLARFIATAAPDAWSGDVPKDYQNEIWTGAAGKNIRTYLEEVDAFATFKIIIEDFEEYLVEVTKSLSSLLLVPVADPQDLRALIDGHKNSGGDFRLRGRIEFVMKESRINTVMEELKDLSRSLESLLSHSESIHHMKQLKATSKQSGYAMTLYTVQRHAHAFFKALRSSWDQTCHPCHETLLRLEDRCLQSSNVATADAESSLEFVALFPKNLAQGELLLSWEETQVLIVENLLSDHLSETMFPATATPAFPPSAPRPCSLFSTDLGSTTAGGQLVPIRNMCRVLLEVGTRILLVSADSCLFRAARQNTTASADAEEGHDTLKLNQFLLQQPNLSPVEKCRFGLSIASSLLQLNLTPWICKCWTKEDIILRRERSADCGYDMARPLIRGRFEQSTMCQRSDDNPEMALLELGILMVQLWTEKTIESWLEDGGRADTDLSNLALRRGLLYEWWNELRKKAPPNYCQVVQICFFPGEFGEVEKSWNDMRFKALYYTNIVEPLLKDLEELLQMQ
ncbi:MAG: hypothetical protein Q9211_004853 [Gyalolechia sp. 1 TL-2023]